METQSTTKRRRWHTFLTGSVVVVCGCTHSSPSIAKKDIHQPWPPEVHAIDRTLMLCPLAQQARNGEIIEATLFNYHFRPDFEEKIRPDGSVARRSVPLPTSDVLPAGSNLIQRLARRYDSGSEFHLFVQTANDVPLDTRNLASGQQKRSELNRQRVENVIKLANAIRPDLLVRVHVIDPDLVGMSGIEGAKGLLQNINNTSGILKPDTFDPRFGGAPAPGPSEPPQSSDPEPGSAPGGLSPG